jgi:hypothetical protein
MFQDSVDKVETELRDLVEEVKDLVEEGLHNLHAGAERTYMSCIEAVSEAQKRGRDDVLGLVRGCKPTFAALFVEESEGDDIDEVDLNDG